MPSIEKKINKRLIALILGGTVVGATAASATPEGQRFWKRIGGFFKSGFSQMKKDLEKGKDTVGKVSKKISKEEENF